MEELFGSAVSGGLLGVLGNFANRAFGIWERREERENMRINNAHELELVREQRITRAQETESEIVTTQVAGSYEGLSESLRHDTSLSRNVSPWVNNIRALVRPVLTSVLTVAMIAMGFVMSDEIQLSVVDAVVFTGVTAVTWWFGDRFQRARLADFRLPPPS